MAEPDEDKPFAIEIAKQGRAVCKKCKEKCLKGELRIAKLAPNPFGDGKMKNWHHIDCIFDVFLKQRLTTKRIDNPEDDISGWETLSDEYKNEMLQKLEECNKTIETKHGIKITRPIKKTDSKLQNPQADDPEASSSAIKPKFDQSHKDNSFREFRRLVAEISNVSSYLEKTKLVNQMFTEGSDGSGFKGDIIMWCRLLLPGFVKKIYNLQSKQLIKLFSKILKTNHDAMLEDLQKGDVSETIYCFFLKSKSVTPAAKSTLTLEEVDDFLEELSQLTKEDEQIEHLKTFTTKCTANDLKVVIRLIKHDLRMNAGAKHILEGVHPDAYEAYQSSRNISDVIKRCLGNNKIVSNDNKTVEAKIRLMTPVLPMLAEACKSVEQAMSRCPNGFYSEIKYDGERVQVHKHGNKFRYFSRSLKEVLPHKVAHFKNYIPQAFPHGKDLILDSEILMIDATTGKPLPFGTLGVHKKTEFKDANVCLFVFDCIYYNGEILTDKPIQYRKKILQENMTEIPNHIVFSEMKEMNDSKDLGEMIAKVLKLGLEGLVLKDIKSIYEPGKRHWLKIKKDYLFGGSMADSADLIVLGAWYGTGKKGGMMSVFLMGCYDAARKKFCTVTKVHTGHDDKTLERLQTELDMIKISSDANKVPSWLKCHKTMVPDFVAKDPKKQPIWEISGAEFTQHDVHTAEGISIRFPRVTKIRDDKNWDNATSLEELKVLVKNSKENFDVNLLLNKLGTDSSDDASSSTNSSPTPRKIQKTLTNYMNFQSTSKRSSSDSGSSKNKKPRIEIKNPLPNYFEHINAILEEGVRENYPDLVRYFIAYGGTVSSIEQGTEATHYVHVGDTISKPEKNLKSNVKHVTINWIKDCIANESVQDSRSYTVKWQPYF